MAPSNLYIDEVYIDTNSGSAYEGITNLLDGEDVHSSVGTTTGFKFLIQIGNGSGSVINMASTTLRVQICINYLNDEGEAISQLDTNIDITSGTIGIDESYYVGWAGITSITPDTASTLYLAAQKNGSGNIIVAPRFRVFLDGTALDAAGTNARDGVNHYYTNSIIHHIFDSTSDADGSLRRKLSSDSPTTTYSAGDWQISTSNHLSASAAGDPHIKTLNNEHYEFDYLGAFRMLEYSADGNVLIINGLSEKGPRRWKTKQYIKKLFIQNNDTNILIDMGFRGSPVKVLENNGISYKEHELQFNKQAKRYYTDNTYSTLNIDEPISEYLPELIRNELAIVLETNKTKETNKTTELCNITLQNVNEYNLQPCRFALNISNKISKLAKGCVIDRKYAPVSKLENIKDLELLEELSLEDFKKIPELEIAPKLRNIAWQ